MKICIVAPAKSGSTAVYNSVRSALSNTDFCYSFFEPQRPYPLLRLKNYDFSANFVTKIMVAKLLSERSDFHFDWFDKRIVLVRDVRDLIVSELLFRPMINPLEIEEAVFRKFVELIREKEKSPQSISVIELHNRANDMGISNINWRIFRDNLNKLIILQQKYDCVVVTYEDYVRGDYSVFRQILSVPIAPTNLDGSWLAHIQRKGRPGEWRNWFTPEDDEFVGTFFSDYIEVFGYADMRELDYNTKPLDAGAGSEYLTHKFPLRLHQIKLLGEASWQFDQVEDFEILISRARDGGAEQIDLLVKLHEENRVPSHLISDEAIKNLKFFRNIIA